ncbi:MAG: sigma-54 dependent transcriptional regulator, partial [Myxococcota bacterium]|nr:sigma-54 dependent transcriptional regulator [Myxococcota bacterium]
LERARSRRSAQKADPGLEGPLLEGAAWDDIRAVLEQIKDTDVSVLIQGESGVGKEVVARAIHESSSRRGAPFVKVNCAALPGGLLESELFGYERGAFTGANSRKAGKFEAADGGTMFLDEIGEMSPEAQAKLLHVLQDGTFTRLGGNKEIQVDARILSATNRPLDKGVASGSFREDLFFRLNVVGVTIPPLRERRDEALSLLHHFLRQASARYGRPAPDPSPRLLKLLERYPFPGNVRELENLVKRIVVLGSEEPVIEDLIQRESRRRARGAALREVLDEVEESAGDLPLREVGRRASMEAEREAIEQVLIRTGWNRKEAARMLKVSYKTLLQKIRDTGVAPL